MNFALQLGVLLQYFLVCETRREGKCNDHEASQLEHPKHGGHAGDDTEGRLNSESVDKNKIANYEEFPLVLYMWR